MADQFLDKLGLIRFWSGVKSYVNDQVEDNITSHEIPLVLTASGWQNNTQTISATGITATSLVIVVPTDASASAYFNAGILCSGQAAGSLTFTCEVTPTVNLNIIAIDTGYLIGMDETDPTVPAWAKEASKPVYTAAEVGAIPDTTSIPSKTSDLTNDSGFITNATETDPTVPAWAKAATKPTYTYSEVGAAAAAAGMNYDEITATLTASAWSNNTQTVSVTGATASNLIIYYPATASKEDWNNAGVWATAQASGTVTFTCETVPTSNLTGKFIVFDK